MSVEHWIKRAAVPARQMEIESQMSDRKVELADLESIANCVDDLRELLKEGSTAERRAFIRGFVKEVKVTGNEVVLSYTMPLIPDNLTMEKEGVRPTVQYGERYRTRTYDTLRVKHSCQKAEVACLLSGFHYIYLFINRKYYALYFFTRMHKMPSRFLTQANVLC